MVFILDDIFEVVIYCIGIAESLTLRVGKISHRMNTFCIGTVGTCIVSTWTIIFLIGIVVPVQTELCFELEVLEDFP